MTDLNSIEFIDLLRQRDHGAISMLIDRLQSNLIKGALAQKISMEQAEDAVAETWSTFFEKIENFEGRSQIKTYLFGIMYNKVREAKRKVSRFVEVDDPNDFLGANFNDKGFWTYTPAEPDSFIQATELKSNLDDCLGGLSDNQRQAFYLKEIQGDSPKDICEELKVTMANFKVTLHRARNQVRRCVEGSYAT